MGEAFHLGVTPPAQSAGEDFCSFQRRMTLRPGGGGPDPPRGGGGKGSWNCEQNEHLLNTTHLCWGHVATSCPNGQPKKQTGCAVCSGGFSKGMETVRGNF